MAEDQIGKTGGNAFFVESAFLDGTLVAGPRVGRPGKKGLAPEDEHEHLQPMAPFGFGEGERAFVVAGKIEKRCEIDFEELFRDGAGTLVIEPPPGAIRENAPAEFAGRQIVYAPKIAEHLSRGGVFLTPATRTAVERPEPALGLDDRETKLITLPFLGETVGAVLRRSVREQQAIGRILSPVSGEVLLPQTRRPPELHENRPDQIVLGLALIGRTGNREAIENIPHGGFEGDKRFVPDIPPVVEMRDRSRKDIICEETSLQGF